VSVRREPPLARSLYAAAEVGQYIPADAFGAVAEILAHVYRAAGRQPSAA
jgi:flagellar biosynthetic protein FlhB